MNLTQRAQVQVQEEGVNSNKIFFKNLHYRQTLVNVKTNGIVK